MKRDVQQFERELHQREKVLTRTRDGGDCMKIGGLSISTMYVEKLANFSMASHAGMP
jgi:hypothetical protein